MQPAEATSSPAPNPGDGHTVLRNTMYLGLAEVLSLPVSVVLNGMMGRYLGAEDMGRIYLASTITGLAYLIVGWGHGGSLPAAVVRDQKDAGTLLGTSIAWRTGAALIAYAVVASGCHFLGFTGAQQWAIGLLFLAGALSQVVSACQDTVRGFERTDIAAFARVGLQLAMIVLVAPVLLLGGRMRLTLLMHSVAGLLVLIAVLRTLRPVGIGKLRWNRERLKELMVAGTPFVFFGLTLVLQPNVDVFYLAKLTSPEVVGWYAVEQRLVGFLLMPATALIGALYPTLCRLHANDRKGYCDTTRGSITTISLLVVPVALGCALYPDIGVSIFGREGFRPAEDTLRVGSVYLFLVYFSMPIGTALVAAGRAKLWTTIQLACVLNGVILDPFLIQHFQAQMGNGGVGLAVTAAISESLMVGAGIALLPRGVFDRRVWKTLSLAVLAGSAMVGASFVLRPVLPGLVAAPLAVSAYAIALYATGAVDKDQVASLTDFVRRKLQRKAAVG